MNTTLDPERWKAIESEFDRLLDLPVAERPRALAAIDDAATRALLFELLVASDRASIELEDSAADLVAPLLDDDAEIPGEEIPERLGPYRLVREIGRGGMGTVYLAERADGEFRQQLAVKLLKRGMDSEAIVRRFLRERQILARLDHPGVARLLDGGTAPDGRPWLAMEHVEGVAVTMGADERRLAVTTRLELFGRICEAVRAAHASLVVHRDLKPSNVLLTKDDQVKLLDFGIAKLVAPDPCDGDEETRTVEARLLTPRYATPEQLLGDPVTTATDVYALGLLLHELLTGVIARPAATGAALVYDREWRPERASAAAMHEPAAAKRAAARSSTPAQLARRLRGDLDQIVARALEPEPSRRYASVEALAEDVRRHLCGLPIATRGDSLGYVAAKFARRHRVAVAAAVAVVSSLAIGLVAALSQAGRARTATTRAEAREHESTVAAAKALQVKEFVLGLFEAANPAVAQGAGPTLRELLDRGAERISIELEGQPAIQSELAQVIAKAQLRLGLASEALPLAERAVQWSRLAFGADASVVGDAQILLSEVGLGAASFELVELALADAQRIFARISTDRARYLSSAVMVTLSKVRVEQRRFDDAIDLARSGVELARAADAPQEGIGQALNQFGCALDAAGRVDEAEVAIREAFELARSSFGENHPDRLMAELEHARVLLKLGRLAEALPLYEDVVARRRVVLGLHHPDLALALKQTAYVEHELERTEDGLAHATEALAINTNVLGSDDAQTLSCRNMLGLLKEQAGDTPGAIVDYRAAIEGYERVFGTTTAEAVGPMYNLASAVEKLGRLDEAESLFRDAIARNVAQAGARHDYTYLGHSRFGHFAMRHGRYHDAVEQFEQAATIAPYIYGRLHRRSSDAIDDLFQAVYATKDAPRALDLAYELLWLREEALQEGDPAIADAHRRIGRAHYLAGRYAESHVELTRSVEQLGACLPETNRVLLRADLDLAYAEIKLGAIAAARARLSRVVTLCELDPTPPQPDALLRAARTLCAGL